MVQPRFGDCLLLDFSLLSSSLCRGQVLVDERPKGLPGITSSWLPAASNTSVLTSSSVYIFYIQDVRTPAVLSKLKLNSELCGSNPGAQPNA